MIPVDQDEFYPGGNCWEACMASILDRQIDDFRAHARSRFAFHRALEAHNALTSEQKAEGDGWRAAYRHREAYQREQRRLGFVVVKVEPPTAHDGVTERGARDLGAIPRGYAIANGPGPRAKPDGEPIYHSCVALDGVVVHDPHPSRAGLVEIEWYELLVPVLS